MGVWQWLTDSAGAVLLLFLLYGAYLVLRRRWLSRHGGTFELSFRVRSARAGRGWVLGLGRYNGERLEWFRIFSPSPRARRVWQRTDMEYVGQRYPSGVEGFSLYGGHVVIECRSPRGRIELAMSPQALTGFQSWLEAAPPGTGADSV
ncbi:MAG: DUF2550 domain-containing protein [Actinomycetota bacterium]|nr:DUF2550 domain-containing protein [Actinomycetota bacterium]